MEVWWRGPKETASRMVKPRGRTESLLGDYCPKMTMYSLYANMDNFAEDSRHGICRSC